LDDILIANLFFVIPWKPFMLLSTMEILISDFCVDYSTAVPKRAFVEFLKEGFQFNLF